MGSGTRWPSTGTAPSGRSQPCPIRTGAATCCTVSRRCRAGASTPPVNPAARSRARRSSSIWNGKSWASVTTPTDASESLDPFGITATTAGLTLVGDRETDVTPYTTLVASPGAARHAEQRPRRERPVRDDHGGGRLDVGGGLVRRTGHRSAPDADRAGSER